MIVILIVKWTKIKLLNLLIFIEPVACWFNFFFTLYSGMLNYIYLKFEHQYVVDVADAGMYNLVLKMVGKSDNEMGQTFWK